MILIRNLSAAPVRAEQLRQGPSLNENKLCAKWRFSYFTMKMKN